MAERPKNGLTRVWVAIADVDALVPKGSAIDRRGGGAVERAEVYRATVRNHAKLAYDAVAAWLDGGAPPPKALAAVPGLDENLRWQDARSRDDRAAGGVRRRGDPRPPPAGQEPRA